MSAYYGIKEQKKQLRADYLAQKRALDGEQKAKLDARITAIFTGLVSFRYANVLLLYYPRPDEVDTRPIIAAALAAGKQVALPRCQRDGKMDFHFIQSKADLVPGSFNIPEPREDCPIFAPWGEHKGVLMALPGVAFDRKGFRLGYGKGYYDRYLANRQISTAGLIYSDFVTNELPRGHFDLPVQLLVTEKGVLLVE